MGTDYSGEGNCGGIIPQVMDTIFRKVDTSKDGSEFLIRVSFIEVRYLVALVSFLFVPASLSLLSLRAVLLWISDIQGRCFWFARCKSSCCKTWCRFYGKSISPWQSANSNPRDCNWRHNPCWCHRGWGEVKRRNGIIFDTWVVVACNSKHKHEYAVEVHCTYIIHVFSFFKNH